MSDACSDGCEDESEAGTLLADLERRQDDVLAQLDVLDRQLSGLLRGLGVTLLDESEPADTDPQRGELLSDEDDVETIAAASGFAKLPSDRPLTSAVGPASAAAQRDDQRRVLPQRSRSARAA